MGFKTFIWMLEGFGKLCLFLSFWFVANEILPEKLLATVRRSILAVSVVAAISSAILFGWSAWGDAQKSAAQHTAFSEPQWPQDEQNPVLAAKVSVMGYLYYEFARWAPAAAQFILPPLAGLSGAVVVGFGTCLALTYAVLGDERAAKWQGRKFAVGDWLFVIGAGLDFLTWLAG